MRKRRSKNQKGFTLFELLIVIGVLALISSVVTTILVATLRSVGKTAILTSVNQNGDYAINQMTQNIRYAKTFLGVSTDNTTYVTNCVGSSTAYQYIKVVGFDGGTTTYACSLGTPPNIASTSAAGSVALLDTTAVNLVSCTFTCSQNTQIDPPLLGVTFSLQKNSTPSGVENYITPLTFRTSLIMRNH